MLPIGVRWRIGAAKAEIMPRPATSLREGCLDEEGEVEAWGNVAPFKKETPWSHQVLRFEWRTNSEPKKRRKES